MGFEMRIAVALAVPLALAGCGQSGSGNVMAPPGNALSPAQIDAALGPEVANGAAAPASDLEEVGATNDVAENASDPDRSGSEAPRPRSAPEEAPEEPAEDSGDDHSGHEMPVANNSTE